MSSTAPSKRSRTTNSLPSGKGLFAWVKPVFTSTVGMKYMVALTGLALTGFVVAHLVGNLQVFLGPEALNAYAVKLKDMGPLLWIARIGLLTIFLVHIVLGVRLKLLARNARPIGYAHEDTVQASIASRTMVISGLVILVFVIFHIAHYTLGFVQVEDINGVPTNLLDIRDPKGRHDVYRMTIYGFSNPIIAILYIVGQLALGLHLSHGVASMFQSLGLSTPRLQGTWRILAWGVTLIVTGGNIAMVVAVWVGVLRYPYPW